MPPELLICDQFGKSKLLTNVKVRVDLGVAEVERERAQAAVLSNAVLGEQRSDIDGEESNRRREGETLGDLVALEPNEAGCHFSFGSGQSGSGASDEFGAHLGRISVASSASLVAALEAVAIEGAFADPGCRTFCGPRGPQRWLRSSFMLTSLAVRVERGPREWAHPLVPGSTPLADLLAHVADDVTDPPSHSRLPPKTVITVSLAPPPAPTPFHLCDSCHLPTGRPPHMAQACPYTVRRLEAGTVHLFCRCGLSSTMPFCDRSCADRPAAADGTRWRPQRFAMTGKAQARYSICGCGYTRAPPICDATHGRLGCIENLGAVCQCPPRVVTQTDGEEDGETRAVGQAAPCAKRKRSGPPQHHQHLTILPDSEEEELVDDECGARARDEEEVADADDELPHAKTLKLV